MKKYIPLLFVVLISLYPLLKPAADIPIDSSQVFQSPSLAHFGGTDSLGRDLFHRCFTGAGLSLWICFLSLILTYGLGLIIGSFLSYWRRSNHLVVFMIDIFDSIPNFLLVALFSILINRGLSVSESFATAFTVLVVSIALSAWPPIARNVRLEILQLKGKDYLSAAVTAGASPFYIIRTHYFRAIWPWLRVSIIHNIPQFLLIESVLSFTGFGLGSHQATLGYLIYEGWKNALLYPHLFILPSLILCALVFMLTSGIQEPT
jgi:oligopeptide transport system permease protein